MKRNESNTERERRELEDTWRRPGGISGLFRDTDHKVIGLRYIITAVLFLVLGGILALGMRLQLARPSNHVLSPDVYNQFFTTHGTSMMFLFAVPVMLGMGIYFVPLLVGTRTVAFPRLLSFSYWTYLFGGLLLYGSLIAQMGPDVGWFAYTPLSGPAFAPGHRVDAWTQMVTEVEISSMAAAIVILATALKQRAPGMRLDRIPIFVWSEILTCFMVILAMPSVTLVSTFIATDRMRFINTQFFNAAEGGDNMLWQHLFWFFAHPEVYILFLPANGFVSEILPAFTRRRIFGYPALVLSMVAIAFLSFGVWAHHMFVTPLPQLGIGLFSASSFLISIPSVVQMFCWIASLWGGRIQLKAPMWFLLAFFINFAMGGLTGVMVGAAALDTQVHDSFFVVAHLHYVIIGGSVFPLFAAFYYWFPKWTGRLLNDRAGFWNCVLLFIGFHLAFFPMHLLGMHGMPRRIYTYLPETGWGPLNLLSTIGAFVIALAILVFTINVIVSLRRGRLAGPNPWGASTLEWSTASPPPRYNYVHPPTVASRDPLWDDGPDTPVVTGLSTAVREVLVTSTQDAEPDHRFHVAHDSIWPFLAAVVVGGTFLGAVFHPMALPYGLLGLLVTLAGWTWPRPASEPTARSVAAR